MHLHHMKAHGVLVWEMLLERQGGNTIDDATVVDNLTESLEGTTVGYEDSYDEVVLIQAQLHQMLFTLLQQRIWL